MRLEVGQRAPGFTLSSADGEEHTIAHPSGRARWLSLQRYAACPFCSWRVHRLVHEQESIADSGLDLIVVVPSPPNRVQQYTMKYKPSFTVLCDPSETVHTRYQAETSWKVELQAAMNLPKAIARLAHAPNNPLAVDGPIHRVPAEFLITADGEIAVAHYGKDLDDGIAVDDARAWAINEGPRARLTA